jgi:hypothetical protein
MKIRIRYLMPLLLGGLLLDCASEKVSYDLPSAGSKEKPTWVGTQRAARDTIFIVVQVAKGSGPLNSQVQEAQSGLHGILVDELDKIIQDYWLQKNIVLTEEEQYTALSKLPLTLEAVMKHVSVTDGWDNEKTRSYLCAIDYQDAAMEIMEDFEIDDVAFRSYLKRRMDELSRKYH